MRGVSATNFPQILWTPLFVKYPGERQGLVDDRPARSTDVLPTIASTVGVRMPWTVDGRSLRAAPRRTDRVRTLDWSWSTLHPARGRFLTVDGAKGFAAVRRARATDQAGDPNLRLYRIGPYGALIGTAVPSGVPRAPAASTTISGSLLGPIDPDAHDAPWARPTGILRGVAPGQWLAISVNRSIAGLTRASATSDGQVLFWAALPPAMFRAGRNDIAVWEVLGPAARPQLRAVTISASVS
jgi:hypothetical protein